MEGKLSLRFCFKLKAALLQLITAWLMKHALKGQQGFREAQPVICSHNKFGLNLRTRRVCRETLRLSPSQMAQRSQNIIYEILDFSITKLNNTHPTLALNTKLSLLLFTMILLITEFSSKPDSLLPSL